MQRSEKVCENMWHDARFRSSAYLFSRIPTKNPSFLLLERYKIKMQPSEGAHNFIGIFL